MLRVTPAEIFGCGIDKPIEKLKQLQSVIKDMTFDEKPPYNVFAKIFHHCVREHGAWTRDLIVFHLGEQVSIFEPYTQSILSSVEDVDFEFVLENLFHTQITMLQDVYSGKIKGANDGDLKQVVRDYASQLGKMLLDRCDSTPLMDAHTLLTTNTINDTPKKTLALNLGFDEHMEGGLHEGEVLFVMAPTGAGKSTIMLYESIMAIMQGYNALYVSLEMSEQLIRRRLTSLVRALNVPEHILKRLYIKRFPTKGVTLDEVMALVDSLDIDAFILDYLDLLKMTSGSKGVNPWLDLEELSAYFRGQLVERELMGITGSQISEKNEDLTSRRRIVQMSDIRASLGKVYTADYVITVTPVMANDAGANMILFLAKNRRGRNWLQPCRADFEAQVIQPILGVSTMNNMSVQDLLGNTTEGRVR
jgi:DnaB-like helicase C terminal domain